jgi:hypothetical protein
VGAVASRPVVGGGSYSGGCRVVRARAGRQNVTFVRWVGVRVTFCLSVGQNVTRPARAGAIVTFCIRPGGWAPWVTEYGQKRAHPPKSAPGWRATVSHTPSPAAVDDRPSGRGRAAALRAPTPTNRPCCRTARADADADEQACPPAASPHKRRRAPQKRDALRSTSLDLAQAELLYGRRDDFRRSAGGCPVWIPLGVSPAVRPSGRTPPGSRENSNCRYGPPPSSGSARVAQASDVAAICHKIRRTTDEKRAAAALSRRPAVPHERS